jgi:voltage-dependent calcium channel L type alpha-1D
MQIFLVIIVNSIALAMYNPIDPDLSDPNSTLSLFLLYGEYCFTSIFTIEAIFKIVALGFWSNGPTSYLRQGWNVIDIVLVILGILGWFPFFNNNFSPIRTIRLLRPLRTIARNNVSQSTPTPPLGRSFVIYSV